jgi:hypothetical protein
MDAELVLDRHAVHVVALAWLAIFIQQKFRHQEQGNALDPLRGVGQAGQHQVNDVVGHLVIAPGDEDLLPRDEVVIAFRNGPAGNGGQVRTGLRFGQVHRAGPFAADHFRQVGRFQFVRAVLLQGVDRAMGQERA